MVEGQLQHYLISSVKQSDPAFPLTGGPQITLCHQMVLPEYFECKILLLLRDLLASS